MKIQIWSRRLVLTLAAALGTVAYAQGTSVLLGTVTDAASGKKLADVVVTAVSSTTQTPQVTVTDSSGYYRLPGLSPGRYTLRIEKEGYRPYSRNDLEVSLDRQYRVNIAAQPESMSSEEITITGLPPIIDIGSVNQGAVLNTKFIERMPVVTQGNTNFLAVVGVAPQAGEDPKGGGIAFSGATGPENSYTVDGVSVRNNQSGGNSGIVPIGFIDQINVITGGFQAEVGRATGGAVRAVTRSGGNEFHGEVWAKYIPGGMLPMPKVVHSQSSAIVQQDILWNSIDVNASLGGPIIKDRLWFFAGFNPSRIRTQNRDWLQAFKLNEAGTDYLTDSSNNLQYTNIEGSRSIRFRDDQSLPYIAKLTLLLSPNHTLTLTTNGTFESASVPRTRLPRGPADVMKWNGGSSANQFNNSLLLQYQGSFFDKKLLAQGQVSWYRSSTWTDYSDGSTLENGGPGSATGTPAIRYRYNDDGSFISYNDLPWLSRNYDDDTRARIAAACQPSIVNGKRTDRCPLTIGGAFTGGGAAFIQSKLNDTVQASFSLTYLLNLLGHHVWKAGIDYEWIQFVTTYGYSGGYVYGDTRTAVYLYRGYGVLTGPDENHIVKSVTTPSSSHQIAWYLQDSWSIMDKVTLNAGVRFDNQHIMNTSGAVGLALNNQAAPRLSLIWDPTQQGRSKIYASYGRYFESVPLSIANRQLTGEPQIVYNGVIPSSPRGPTCNPVSNFNTIYTGCAGGPNQVLRNGFPEPLVSKKWGYPGTMVSPIDPDLKPQSSDEVTAGAEYEIFRDARLSASYTRRWINYAVEDMSLDEGATYFISNPGYGLGSGFPKAVRNYNAVTVQFTKAFSSGWTSQASYTWMNLTGNYEGLINSVYGTGQTTDPNITSSFDLRSLLLNANGRLPGNQAHTIKLYGGKEFSIGKRFALGVFLSYVGRSGRPMNYMGSNAAYGAGMAYILPMGSGGDMPWTHNLNLALSAGVRLGSGVNLQFRIDAFNFINLQGATALDQIFTSSDVLPMVVPAGANPQVAACIAGANQPGCSESTFPVNTVVDGQVGGKLQRSEFNKNFKQPLTYQDPFTANFSIRLTF